MIGKKKRAASGILSAALALSMTVTMVPATVMAAEPQAKVDEKADSSLDNLVMNKSVKLEDNGTYTINLEAYAKGQVQTETQTEVKPADIILVLDQSGSMTNSNYYINGIPTGSYRQAGNLSIGDIMDGTYYVKDGDNYYRVSVEEETLGEESYWKGEDGKRYNEDQISYSWKRAFDQREFTTATPFVTSTLKTFTRDHREEGWLIKRNYFWYAKDGDPSETSEEANSASGARTKFSDKYDTATTTVDFRNDGDNDDMSTDEADQYYAAAVYTAVNWVTESSVRYTFTYVDGNGAVHEIASIEGGRDTAYTGDTLYIQETGRGPRLKALTYAADNFINEIRANALANQVDHRIAVVGFASDAGTAASFGSQYYYSNTELFIGGTDYNYQIGGTESDHNGDGRGDAGIASEHYDEAFQNVGTMEGYQNLLASVDALSGFGGTHPQYGFRMANGIFEANPVQVNDNVAERSRIVIFLTDGQPGDSERSFSTSEANATVSEASKTKTNYHARVYTVAVLNNDPGMYSDTGEFLRNTSSNNSYTLATSGEALDDFFESITEDVETGVSTVALSDQSIMVDRLSQQFELPDDFSIAENVTIQTAEHTGNEVFAEPVTVVQSEDGIHAVLSQDDEGDVRGISVRGFNFVSDENVVTTNGEEANGNKLLVTITGVLAKDEAATGEDIATNIPESGIWDVSDTGEYGMVKAFNQPTTKIENKSFVLDYAKEAQLDGIFDTSVDRIDSADDGIFSEVNGQSTTVADTYGDAAVKTVEGGKVLTYTPDQINWNGYDSFYALGKDTANGDQATQNMWSKVNVIPANNVYYEDDFITDASTGKVGIEYTGTWKTDGTASGNKETANTPIHGGWENTDLADDAAYSDGSAHYADAKDGAAKASFTFTGTGVDIYSRTNMETGYVGMKVYKYVDADGNPTEDPILTQSLLIDNKAVSGDYYQIPTASFTADEYGKYKVELTVVSTSDGRSTYYLDGIRVYNPLSAEQEADSTVAGAYGDEVGATFQEVRDILRTTANTDGDTALLSGAVFLDKYGKDSDKGTYDLGEYLNDGPKNEVYLKPGQSVLVKMETADKLSVGLKAPNGQVTVNVTNENGRTEIPIHTASDLYYPVTVNAGGFVMIENDADSTNMLAVTKIKTSGSTEFASYTLADALAYANAFEALPVVDYTGSPSDGSVADTEEPSQPSDEEGDVVIENPDDTPAQEEQPEQSNPIRNWFDSLVNGILNLFGRW